MSWSLLLGLGLVLGMAILVQIQRRRDLAGMRRSLDRRQSLQSARAADAALQLPIIDLSRCLGCGTCVAVCPEHGVLEVIHGQAAVINPARCVGVAACERECPVGAIAIAATRRHHEEVPQVTADLQVPGRDGLFLAGEVTARGLIKNAIEQGAAVAAAAARHARARQAANDVLDLVIIGAGPAGLACSLQATSLGLSFVTLEQETQVGGTVARYPRRKVVLTQPVDLPLHGRLRQQRYSKEELVDLWQGLAAEHDLPIQTATTLQDIWTDAVGVHHVVTDRGDFATHSVCLAVGRRGVPARLGVVGEDLPKVCYSLIDANAWQDSHVLVVGGGDSAAEAAVALAAQRGNTVTLSYRRSALFRIGSKSQEQLAAAVADGSVRLVLSSRLLAIDDHEVEIEVLAAVGDGPAGGNLAAAKTSTVSHLRLRNDAVFIMAGGTAPKELLQRAGVRFGADLDTGEADKGQQELHPGPSATSQGNGLLPALWVAITATVATWIWLWWHGDYYGADPATRAANPKHADLRPGRSIGLWLGISATALIAVNLLYLVRRSPKFGLRLFSLRAWMTVHVATGILAFLLAAVHAGMAPQDSSGGHAFYGLLILLVTGAIGRYFYAHLPRATNGRELELAEARARLAERLRSLCEPADDSEPAGPTGNHQVSIHDSCAALIANIEARQWQRSFVGRVRGLIWARRDLRSALGKIEAAATTAGMPRTDIAAIRRQARRAFATALCVARLEDLRAILATWRHLHRWVAWLMVLLVVVHVVQAVVYGAVFLGGGRP